MTDRSTFRWHVVRGEESVAKFRYIADAEAFATATGGEIRDAENIHFARRAAAAR